MERDDNTLVLAGWGQRIGNYLIDVLLINMIIGFVATYLLDIDFQEIDITNPPVELMYLSYPSTFIYYLIFETTLSKTPGKIITKTRVVDLKGEKPSLFTVLIRSALRLLNIFFILSFFFLMPRNIGGIHDYVSKTRVVDEKESHF